MRRARAVSGKCARRTEQAVLWRSLHAMWADTDSRTRMAARFTGGKTETRSCRVAEPGAGPEESGCGTTCALPQHLAGSSHRLREVGVTVPHAGQSTEAQDTQNFAQGHLVSAGRRLVSFWPFRHLCSQARSGRWTLNTRYVGGLVIIAADSVLQAKGREGLRVHRAGRAGLVWGQGRLGGCRDRHGQRWEVDPDFELSLMNNWRFRDTRLNSCL